MADESIIVCKRKRSVLRTSVSKFINRLESEIQKSKVDEVEELLEQLTDKFEALKLIDSELEHLLKPDDLEKELESAEEYREKIVMWRFRARKFLKLKNETSTGQNHSDNIPNHDGNIRLPKLSVEPFDGKCEKWQEFWSKFESSIHKNTHLTNNDKFNYLTSFLNGPALSSIQGLAITNENYLIAVDVLKDRFGKKEIIVRTHVNKLLNLNPVKSCSHLKELRVLYDTCAIQIRCLENAGIELDSYGSLLYPMLLKLIPEEIILEFNRANKDDESWNCNKLLEFFKTEVENRERTFLFKRNDEKNECERKYPHRFLQRTPNFQQNRNTSNKSFRSDSSSRREIGAERYEKHSKYERNATAANLLSRSEAVKETNKSCVFCSDAHLSSDCKYAIRLTIDERKSILFKKGACFRCLKINHVSRNCKVRVTCSICGKGHSDIMCFSHRNNSPNRPISVDDKSAVEENTVLANHSCSREVYLQTLIVCISGNGFNNFIRIIIDTGSQKSYISKFVAEKMQLKCLGEETVVHGLFGGQEQSEKHKRYLVKLSNIDKSFSCELEVMDQKRICAPIPKLKDSKCIKELNDNGLFVSDIYMKENSCIFEKDPNEINVLLGADVIGKLFTGDITHLRGGLVAVNTRLGWTVMGKTEEGSRDFSNVLLSLHVNNSKISDLWSLDFLGILDPGVKKTREELEDAVRDHFLHTISRDEEGRYIVSLPWIKDHPPLTNCRNMAEKRLKNCVKSLERTGTLSDYEAVFHDWFSRGMIEEINPDEEEETNEHYLPHHPVYKENSTTKVRPVFDGSAREKDSPSINDCLEKGPNVVELIPCIMNRFRLRKYGVVSDIEKAFLQIGLQSRDRPFLRFLWWENGNKENIRIFQHKRVVFGISSSPFLLSATINHHLRNVPNHLRETAQKLSESFYVDNCVSSVNTEEELVKFILESQVILSDAKFNLRGWEHTLVPSTKESSPSQEKKVPVLGLTWNLKNDTLSVNLKDLSNEDEKQITKRKILSAVHRIFDPIGFTCPVTLGPKILLQECWKTGVTWDAELPMIMTKKFERWKTQVNSLNSIEIPRFIMQDVPTDVSMHVFCDASKVAYATCIFLRSQNDEQTTCQLVQARSRVAPLKSISIPRMELLACTIGARLAHSTKRDLGLENLPVFYWSDSVNALYWIKKNENWATFVYNRVQEIRQLTDPEHWRHISGTLNPADLPSRGCNAEELLKTRWWEGPNWLKNPVEEWPVSRAFPDLEVVNAEKRKSVVSATNTEPKELEFYSRISSYKKLIRVMAWIFRFYRNAKNKTDDRNYGELNVEEIKIAERKILKEVQRQSFGEYVKPLMSQLQTLIDSEGLLRVKSKITMRKDLESFRYPIVLPSKHHIVTKLILNKHAELCHAGLQIMMSTLREEYWILKSRKTIRRVLNECIKCKRFTTRPIETISAPLPEDRVREAQVFEVVGVDLCGPLFLKNGNKSWTVLFTCAVFRAVHIELVTSLSTDSFIQALRRFIARRGRPTTIYSDNGTNLVGASNELRSIDWKKLQDYASVKKINWKFNPPSAPWWGGFWERLIGLLKNILRKILGKACLHYEELYTVLCDAESIINARPLTYLSEDIDDLIALTPAMFLQEIKETGVPDMDLIDASRMNKRFAYRQRIRQELRKRFRIEYLGQLREFSKIRKTSDVKEGDVVLVGDTNKKRLNWPLAKVLKLYPGKDGTVRVVEVKTKFGSFLRPVQRLYPVEIQDDQRSSLLKKDGLSTSQDDEQDSHLVPDERGPHRVPVPDEQELSSEPDGFHIQTSKFGRVSKPVHRMNL